MSEAEQEELHELTLPIDWHVPESIQGRYVNNVIAQPGRHEIVVFFFENQIPPYVGTSEEVKNYLLKQGFIRAECIGKMIIDPELMPDIIKALQTGLENYKKAKDHEEERSNR